MNALITPSNLILFFKEEYVPNHFQEDEEEEKEKTIVFVWD